MDLPLGEDTCNRFRQTWMDSVPFILAPAKSTITKNVDCLLKSIKNLDGDFGKQDWYLSKCRVFNTLCLECRSRAAMEVLPLILIGIKRETSPAAIS